MPQIIGRVGNQVRFIFNEAGQIVGYRNPESDSDEPWFAQGSAIDLSASPYSLDPASTDAAGNRALIQQAIDDAYSLSNDIGSSVVINWPGKYLIDGPLNVPDVVCLRGVSASESGVELTGSGFTGHVFKLIPTLGRTEAKIIQHIERIRIDGNSLGLTANTTGDVASGTNTITNVASLTGASVGYIVEGFGIPDRTTITAAGGSTISMSANSAKTAAGVQIIVREAYSTTGEATEGSAVLPVVSSAGMRVGMRMWGDNLEADDDLSAATRIKSVDSATQITLDRPARASGTMAVIAWVEVDGFLVLESTQAVGAYDAGNLYEPNGYVSGRLYSGVKFDHCETNKVSGTGIQIRGGRHQTHVWKGRQFSNWRDGVSMSGANDCNIETGSGSHWRYAFAASACATPRLKGEFFVSKRGDTSEVFINSCRGWQVYESEINGWITVRAKRDTVGAVEPYQIGSIIGVNFIWTQRSNPPDSGVCAFINTDGAVINMVSGGFMVDVGTGLRPHRIATITNGGQVFCIGQEFSDAIADTHCPFSVVVSNNLNAFHRLTLNGARGLASFGRKVALGYDKLADASDSYVLAVGNATALPVLLSPRTVFGRPVALDDSAIAFVTMIDGDTWTIGADRYETNFTAGGTIPAFTVVLPAPVINYEERVLVFHRGVTTLTVTLPSGWTLNSSDTWPATIPSGTTTIRIRYRGSNSTIYRI